MEKTRNSVGEAFVATVELMLKTLDAGGLVVVTGVGKSLQVAEKMSAVFASTGTRSIVLNPVQAMHGDLGMTAPRDMLIALSFSGESEEIVKLVPAIRRHGLKIVAVTGDSKTVVSGETFANPSSRRITSAALSVSARPIAPAGWLPAYSSTVNLRVSTIAIASASPMTIVAVADVVGAMPNGQASGPHGTGSTTSLIFASVDSESPVTATILSP